METPSAAKVAFMMEKVAAYGESVASVLHTFILAAERIPSGLEGKINIINSTVTTLKQALELLNEEALGHERKLFNDEGLRYIQLLTTECATALAKIEPLLAMACLSPREAREKRKLAKKAAADKGEPKINPTELVLDEKAFLEIVETAKWSRLRDSEENTDRLYDIQLHLFLIVQVVKLNSLSRGPSSGKVDVKSIVALHERIARTADLVGIKAPTGRSMNRRKKVNSSSDDGSSSDSDVSRKNTRRRSGIRRCGPPLPPPPPPPQNWSGRQPRLYPPPPPPPATAGPSVPSTIVVVDNSVNPPTYTECNNPASSVNKIPSPLPCITGMIAAASPAPKPESLVSTYPAEKEAKVEAKVEETEKVTRHLELEPRLFKSNTNGFGFKIKSLFRSKQSLAEEMKKALKDSESQLMAYVLRGHDLKEVPHSAFHSLEATHMRTILSQLNDNTWYNTFTTLTVQENQCLERVIRRYNPVTREVDKRDVVVLKVIEQNRLNSWVVLLRDLFQKYPKAYRAGPDRVLLAIVREKLPDNKPQAQPQQGGPSNLLGSKQAPGTIRPPHGLPVPARCETRISDLRIPAPPCAPANWHLNWNAPFPIGRPAVPGFAPPPLFVPSSTLPPGTEERETDIRHSLTVYTEYTLRQVDSTGPPGPSKTWARISITQESNHENDILDRIEKFEDAGGDVIELKCRLSEYQAVQLARLIDELKSSERDHRFDWSWAEISLYTHSGQIAYKDLVATDQEVPFNFAPTATHMHLIARRGLRPNYRPSDVYNSLMQPHPPPPAKPCPPPPGPPPPPPGARGGPPIILPPPQRRVVRRRSSESFRRYNSSDSDSVCWSDSEGEVRRRLRKYRARRIRASNRRKTRDGWKSTDESGSSSSEGEDEDDVIELQIVLKRGDDVVKALIEKWTPESA